MAYLFLIPVLALAALAIAYRLRIESRSVLRAATLRNFAGQANIHAHSSVHRMLAYISEHHPGSDPDKQALMIEVLNEISMATLGATPLDDVLETALSQLSRIINYDSARLCTK